MRQRYVKTVPVVINFIYMLIRDHNKQKTHNTYSAADNIISL